MKILKQTHDLDYCKLLVTVRIKACCIKLLRQDFKSFTYRGVYY